MESSQKNCKRFVAAAVVAFLTAYLLLRARVLIRTANMKKSRRHLAAYVGKLHRKACCTWIGIIFPHSTDQVIDTREGEKKEKIYIFFSSRMSRALKNHERLNNACCASYRTTGDSRQEPDFFQ